MRERMKVRRTRRTRPFRTSLKSENGQNLVEFALVVPLLLLLVVGIAEFGRGWMTKNILTGAAREAVRLLAVPAPGGGPAAATSRAVAILATAGITADNLAVTDAASYEPVSVTITYNFPVLFPGFIPGMDNVRIPLISTTTMRREY